MASRVRDAGVAMLVEHGRPKTLTRDGRQGMDLLTWTIAFRSQLDTDILFDLSRHLYLPEIYLCPSRRISWKKAAQVGASEYALSKTLHACDILRAHTGYILPKMGSVRRFSQSRLKPAIKASPYLSDIMSNEDGVDNVFLKSLRSRLINLAWGRVDKDGMADQLKTWVSDFNTYDELDEMDLRAVDIANHRMDHSDWGGRLDISTPTYSEWGIDVAYKESDQRRWLIPCNHCNHWQCVTIEHVVNEWDGIKRPTSWNGMKEGTAWVACEKCHKKMNCLVKGKWVATYPERSKDHAGFHINKLVTSYVSPMEIVTNLRSTDPTTRKETVNQTLGETHDPPGGRMDEATLKACKLDYYHSVETIKLFRAANKRPLPIVAGIDVGDMNNVVIRTMPDEHGRRHQLYVGELFYEEEIVGVLKRYGVSVFVIDQGPETRLARKIQDSFPMGVGWLCFYNLDSKSPEPVVVDWKNGQIRADKVRTLDATFDRFRENPDFGGLRENSLPINIEAIERYFPQMTAPVRTKTTSANGMPIIKYEEGAAKDHYAHAENYCTIASLIPQGFVR